MPTTRVKQQLRIRDLSPFAIALLAAPLFAAPVLAQTASTAASSSTASTANSTKPPRVFDPGPRPIGNKSAIFKGVVNNNQGLTVGIVNTKQPPDNQGNAGAGAPLAGMTKDQTAFWGDALVPFGQLVTVNGATDPATGNPTILGLGPAFNGNSCFMCHSFPAIGGTSPPNNPEVAVATANGATNTIPAFVVTNGPVVEARFPKPPTTDDGLPGGAVRELFTIQGRSDAPLGCGISQPDFQTELANNNVIFRIPTPLFGLGFVENTSDQTLEANLAATASERSSLGISGHFNTNGNDQTITRFGWKAQNKSLLLFAGEAANVELGLTNEIFGNERIVGTNCTTNKLPEDLTNIVPNTVLGAGTNGGDSSLVSSAIENFTIFMKLNSAPSQCAFDSGTDSTGAAVCTPFANSPNAAAIADGQTLFGFTANGGVGCADCHSPTLTTDASPFAPLNNASFHPFSDFALHNMGGNLADGVSQGGANGKEFRTAPLWGIGQRLFFLHDGRASDLLTAINAHKSSGSEANTVISNFKSLTNQQQQDILDFLRSL